MWQPSPADTVTLMSVLFTLSAAMNCQEPFDKVVVFLVWVKQRFGSCAVVALSILALVALLVVLLGLGGLGIIKSTAAGAGG